MDPLRIEYDVDGLVEANLAADPVDQFTQWFDEAVRAELPEANMMTLATVDSLGMPDARVVLLKEHGHDGFVFYTNYGSTKAEQLAAHPYATLVFHWQPLHRQVRISGMVEKVDPEQSDAYFASRPRGSQLAARASRQSIPIADRRTLLERYEREDQRWAGAEVPRPDDWGGYRLVPGRFEFWQGQVNRMHDRIRFAPIEGGWSHERLSP
jgi:pyridoxamine 5'-phosphate oxidase